jgi:hypothetical protein
MRTVLASLAFLLFGISVVACTAVAVDGYINFGGYLPVLRTSTGITPIGAAVLLVAVSLGALFLVVGISLKNDRR